MKITKSQLRKLIAEAFRMPLFDPVTSEEMQDLRLKSRLEAGLSDEDMDPERLAKLKMIGEVDPEHMTTLYQSLGSDEIDLDQETDFLKGQDAMLQGIKQANYDDPLPTDVHHKGGRRYFDSRVIDIASELGHVNRHWEYVPGEININIKPFGIFITADDPQQLHTLGMNLKGAGFIVSTYDKEKYGNKYNYNRPDLDTIEVMLKPYRPKLRENKMKITRSQLRKLIAESISDIKSGGIGQVPYEHPEMELRREIGDEYTEKLNKLKADDPVYRDKLADTLGYDSEFGSLSEDEFEHNVRMAAQDPNEAVRRKMSYMIGSALRNVRNGHRRSYTAGNNYAGDNYYLADQFLTELISQNLAPRNVLDRLFDKISKELKSGYKLMLSELRSLMSDIADYAFRENFISRKEARRYIGDDVNYHSTREIKQEYFPDVIPHAEKYRK